MGKINFAAAQDLTSENKICVGTILKSVVFAYIITLIIFFIFAIVITYTNMPEGIIPIVVMATTMISIVLSAIKVAKKVKIRGWLNGAICGFVYIVMLYIISSLALTGFVFDKHVMYMFILGIASGAFGGIIGVNMRGKSYNFRK